MMMMLLLLLLSACQSSAVKKIASSLAPLQQPVVAATQVWPVISALNAPNGLRPCCAFGYNLRAEIFGIPVPWYQLDNVVAANRTGKHHYNDNPLYTLATLAGVNGEYDGLIYTRLGGFIDLAHLRDSADNTLWLFSQIWPRLGEAQTLILSDELGERRIRLLHYAPPTSQLARYNLAILLSAHLSFELAAWHEVAQWYGFESIPGFSEGVSAFSPEDLYSNLLGVRIAIDLLNAGEGASLLRYQQTMEQMIPQALKQLQAGSPPETRFHFDMLDGLWWNSHCRLPQKFLLRHRNYNVSEHRLPSRPWESVAPMLLTLPDHFMGIPLAHFGRLEIARTKSMARLPAPRTVYSFRDFTTLAQQAEQADRLSLMQPGKHCE